MLPGDFDGSWARVGPSLVTVTSAAQLAAATAGVQYVPAVLAQQDIAAPAEAHIRPSVFAGIAYDARPLDSLLEGAVRVSKMYVKAGRDGGDALVMGRQWLDGALQTIVTDAARDATAVGMAVRPDVTSWVRMVNPPCCSRCAVLAGVVYKWNQPLPRHPRCDCLFIPTTVANADSYLADPSALARRGLIKDLTPAQRKRLDEGADLTKVLNESRDAWRQRMAVERGKAKAALKAEERARQEWGKRPTTPLPPGGIQDFLAHLTRDVAIRQMRAAGIAD